MEQENIVLQLWLSYTSCVLGVNGMVYQIRYVCDQIVVVKLKIVLMF